MTSEDGEDDRTAMILLGIFGVAAVAALVVLGVSMLVRAADDGPRNTEASATRAIESTSPPPPTTAPAVTTTAVPAPTTASVPTVAERNAEVLEWYEGLTTSPCEEELFAARGGQCPTPARSLAEHCAQERAVWTRVRARLQDSPELTAKELEVRDLLTRRVDRYYVVCPMSREGVNEASTLEHRIEDTHAALGYLVHWVRTGYPGSEATFYASFSSTLSERP